MARKSIFRRNKNKVEKQEEQEKVTDLKSSLDTTTLDINDELYNEINSNVDTSTFAYGNSNIDTNAFAYQANEEVLKPALKKKERKPERKELVKKQQNKPN